MTAKKSINEFFTYLINTKKAAANTVSAYQLDISTYSEYAEKCGFDIVTAKDSDIEKYKKHLVSRGFSTSSVSRAMSSLRGYYKFLNVTGVIDSNPAKAVKNDKNEKKTIDVITSEEVDRLLSQPDVKDIKGLRDKAMLELMYATGIKVSELISLNVSDVNLQLGCISCHGTESSKHDRRIYIYPTAVKTIRDYLKFSRAYLVDDDFEPLFVNIGGTRITRQGFWKILKSYAARAGITKPITPHILRNSFATHLLENGADINDIKEILGHSDISSTLVYANYLKSKGNKSYLKFHPRA
ncbi:MAG: tyrosine-type recombinase/integrase [Clostridiales bacterium]|nr:tyrosine-type recombinase/integrase [Clostridiales bacterium]